MEYARAVTEFWAKQGQDVAAAMLQAQQQAGQAVVETLQAAGQAAVSGTLPGMPTDLSAGAAELSRASQAMMEMWSAATSLSSGLAAKLPGGGGDAAMESVFARLVDPRQFLSGSGEMDDVLGRMAEGPRFADLFEIERRYARVVQAWMDVRRRGLEHNATVLQGWQAAAQRFTEELAGLGGAEGQASDTRAPDTKAMMALWTDIANKQLLETQRSEPFLRTQRETIRASTDLRLAQQELVEHFGKQYGFPTRTEIDDVHRTVTELRRELRTLRREVRQAAAPGAPALAAAELPKPLPSTPARVRAGGKQRSAR